MGRKNKANGNGGYSVDYGGYPTRQQGGYSINYGGDNSAGQGYSMDYGSGQGYTVDYGSGQGYLTDYGSGQMANGSFYVAPGTDPYAGQMTTVVPQQPEPSTGKKVMTFLGRSITITLKYFAAKMLISIIMGVAAWLIFMFLGIPHPGILGIVLCIGNCIPIIGEWLAAAIIIIPLLIPAINSGSYMTVIYTAVTLVVLEGIDDFVLTPLIVGKSLSFKPIIVLLVTIAVSIVGGPVLGIMFAIPIIAIGKLFLDIFWFKKNLDR